MEGKVEMLRYDRYEKKEFSLDVDCKEMLTTGAEDAAVLACHATAAIGRCEVLNNEAVIEGTVRFCTVIKNGQTEDGANGGFDSLVRTERFTYNAQLEGVNPKAFLTVRGCPKKVRGYIEAGTLMLTAEIRLCAELVTPEETKVITQLKGDDIHTLSGEIQADEIVARGSCRFQVRQDVELSVRMPEVKQPLCTATGIRMKEMRCADDQIMLRGEIAVQTLYSCEDEYEPLAQIADQLEFSQIIDARGAAFGMEPDGKIELEDIFVTVQLNEQGERRVLTYECMLSAQASAGTCHSMCLIKDAFSTDSKLELTGKKIYPVSRAASLHASCVEKLEAPLPSGKPPIARICSVQVQPCITEAKAWDGKGILACEAEISVVYIAAISGSIESYRVSRNFTLQLDHPDILPAHMLTASISVEQIQAVMTGGSEAEVRATFSVEMTAMCKQEESILLACDRGEALPKEGSAIIIYVMQPGDTLWSVCRRLGVGLEELKKVNPEAGDDPGTGTRLIIYKQLKP